MSEFFYHVKQTNCLLGFHMFSGDGTGLIIIWNTFVKENSQSAIQHWGIDKVYRKKSSFKILCT